MTGTTDLAAWLTAVWDEEERLATEAYRAGFDFHTPTGEHWGVPHVIGRHMLRHEPTAVLARIAADRKILADYLKAVEDSRPSGNPTLWGKEARFGLGIAVQHMADGYRDRPDFPAEWLVERQGVEG